MRSSWTSSSRDSTLPPRLTPGDRAYALVNGFRATQIVHAAVELGIPDLIAQGRATVDELSAATGIDRGRLRRLLRALVGLGVLTESDADAYTNTEVGELFREDVPGSRRPQVRMLVPESYRNWERFMETLRTGVTGQQLAHGATLWELMARDPDFGARFNAAMASNTESLAQFVATAGDFRRTALVVDVGGGEGSLVAGILRAHAGLHGIVFDLPAGLTQTNAYLREHQVLDRCTLVEGDFFRSVPAADAYLLKDILHDWADGEATAILNVCRRAMNPSARVMVVERVMPSRVTDSPQHLNATITDLQMMTQLGGKERTVEEFSALFEAAELKIDRLTPGGVYQLIEAVAV